MTLAQQVTDPIALHAEGAVWSERWGGLKWVDMHAGDVLSLDATSGHVSRLHTGSGTAAMVRPRTAGGMVIATEREFTLWDAEGRQEWASPALWDSDGLRFNEGGCAPDGSVLCGSLSKTHVDGSASVLRMRPDHSTDIVFGGVTVSNGLGFTADGSRMYYVDTATRRIDLFDVAGHELVDRRALVTVAVGPGYPDGLWVDEDDGVWVALYGGSAVHHYGQDGTLLDVIDVPATRVTSCTFGGDDLGTLFITTSREDLEGDHEPLAGSVFSADVGVRGLPVLEYAG